MVRSKCANLLTVETAIASFKQPLTRQQIQKGVRKSPYHLSAMRYIRDCRLADIEPCHKHALKIAKGKLKV